MVLGSAHTVATLGKGSSVYVIFRDPPGGHFGRGVVGRIQSPSDSAYMRLRRPPASTCGIGLHCAPLSDQGHITHATVDGDTSDGGERIGEEGCPPCKKLKNAWTFGACQALYHLERKVHGHAMGTTNESERTVNCGVLLLIGW